MAATVVICLFVRFDNACLITVLIITPDDLGDNSAATNSLGTLKVYQYLVLQSAIPGGVFKVNLAPGAAQVATCLTCFPGAAPGRGRCACILQFLRLLDVLNSKYNHPIL